MSVLNGGISAGYLYFSLKSEKIGISRLPLPINNFLIILNHFLIFQGFDYSHNSAIHLITTFFSKFTCHFFLFLAFRRSLSEILSLKRTEKSCKNNRWLWLYFSSPLHSLSFKILESAGRMQYDKRRNQARYPGKPEVEL